MPAPSDKKEEAFESRLSGLFDDAPPTPETKPDEVVEEEVEEVVEEKEEVVVEDEKEEDYEEPIEKPKEEEDEILEESVAQKEAKRRGKEAKELKTQLTERELELERERTEKAELRAKLEEIEAVKVKPEDHSDYQELYTSIKTDIVDGAEELPLPEPDLVWANMGPFMNKYLEMSGKQGSERAEARANLKEIIVDSLKLSDIPYAELEPDEKKAFDSISAQVTTLIQRNAGKTKELQKLHTTLSEKAKTGQLSVGVREYESRASKFRPILESVGDLSDDLIEANPYAIESVVAKLIKSSPEAARRAQNATNDVLELMIGPRVLTQKEIDSMEAKGESVKEYLAERAKLHEAKQLKFAAMFKQGLLTRALLKETLAKLAKYEAKEESEESERDALRKTGKKKAAPVVEKKRGTALDRLFADD